MNHPIEIKSLTHMLESMRIGEPLKANNLLLQIIDCPDEGAYTEFYLWSRLSHFIRNYYLRIRKINNLGVVQRHANRVEALSAMRSDFCQSNEELEAWSTLYYRYVRIDLALSVAEIADTVSQAKRTIQRRRNLGIVRLLHCLLRHHRRTKRAN